jgi:hypothetical protein
MHGIAETTTEADTLPLGFLPPDPDVMFCSVMESPQSPPNRTWFILGISRCPVFPISRRIIWKNMETPLPILQFFLVTQLNLGLGILSLDRVLVFCETKTLN